MNTIDDIFEGLGEMQEEAPEVTPFDKEEWALQKKQERDKAYQMIDEMADIVSKDGNRLKETLNVMAKFDRYSVGNVLLVAAQKPDARKLADFNTWKECDVRILKGETGILILEPGKEYIRADGSTAIGYNAKKLFDISQTSDKDKADSVVAMDGRFLLKALLQNVPCKVTINDEFSFPSNMNALYEPQEKTIYMKRGCDENTAFRELVREIALAVQDKGEYNRASAFFSGYCAAYVLCRRNNIEMDAFNFEKLPEEIMALDPAGMRTKLNEIRNIANDISRNMNQFLEKQKSRDDGAR